MTDDSRGQRIVQVHVTNPRPDTTGTIRDTGTGNGRPTIPVDDDNGWAKPAFVALRHTPDLRLPHARFAVTRLRLQTGRPCTTFTGLLTCDATPVAALAGGPGGTRLTTLLDGFVASVFTAFVAGCRHRGGPVTERRLLDALVDERHLDQMVAQAAMSGGTYARLINDSGHTVALRHINPVPDRAGLPRLRRFLAAETGTTGDNLQIWTCTAWTALTDDADTAEGPR